jgi:hypothetical protein
MIDYDPYPAIGDLVRIVAPNAEHYHIQDWCGEVMRVHGSTLGDLSYTIRLQYGGREIVVHEDEIFVESRRPVADIGDKVRITHPVHFNNRFKGYTATVEGITDQGPEGVIYHLIVDGMIVTGVHGSTETYAVRIEAYESEVTVLPRHDVNGIKTGIIMAAGGVLGVLTGALVMILEAAHTPIDMAVATFMILASFALFLGGVINFLRGVGKG